MDSRELKAARVRRGMSQQSVAARLRHAQRITPTKKMEKRL